MEKQWGNLRLSFILISLSFGVMSFLLPIYSKEMGMNAAEIGGMFSILSFVILICKPIIGRWTDRIGWKWFLVIAMSTYALAFCILADATNIWFLYMSRILQGIGSAFLGIASYSMSVSIVDEDKVGQQIGRVASAHSIGIMLGTGICFLILSRTEFLVGWQRLFRIYALLAGVGALLIALRIKTNTKVPKKHMKSKETIKYSKEMLGLLLITFLLMLSSSMLSPIFMVYLQDNVTTNVWGVALAFIPVNIIYSVFSGRLGGVSDKYGHTKIMLLRIGISCLVTLLIPSTNSLIFLAILWSADAVGDILERTARIAFQSKLVGKETKGEVYGVYSSVASIGTIIGPFIGGLVYDRIAMTAPFYMNGVLLMIVCILILLMFNKPKLIRLFNQ